MDGKRTTSRVTNEPGGKSSVQLGWDSPKTKEPKDNRKEKENFMQVVGSATASKPNTNKIEDKAKGTSSGRKGVSSNSYASGSSQNTGNVITDRPTSRVTQPPGGRSSISFY
mmetsp:Transcript_2168/g.5089  ORF Transcript_2168/g.5089 Transcript_2168/m.5089 type:complete len:112 (-) Transcript_2168:266-601(-)